jgi:hypothetical protein
MIGKALNKAERVFRVQRPSSSDRKSCFQTNQNHSRFTTQPSQQREYSLLPAQQLRR